MNTLALEVRVVNGANLNDSVRDACAIAVKLGLHHVAFEANDESYACYSDGTAQRFSMTQANGREMWDGKQWTHVPPVVEGPPSSRLATFPRDVVGVCQTCGHEWRCVAWEQTPSGGARLDTPRCPRCGAGYEKLYCRELPEVEITTHSDTRRTFKDLGTGKERDGGPLPTMDGE